MALASWMLSAGGPRIEQKWTVVDGHRVHSLVTGAGPNLVLVHGLLGSAEAWFPCFARLGYESTVCAVDALGIGRSDRVPGLDAGLAAQADRLAEFLRASKIGRADLVGTSHGGAVSMMLAARHPELVRSLILHAPANPFSPLGDHLVSFYRSPLGRWFAHQVPGLPKRLQDLALGRMYGNARLAVKGAVDRYMDSLRVPGTVDHVLRIVDGWFDDMRELESVLGRLKNIPTLLMWGTHDRAVSLESGQMLEERLDRAEIVILPGVGHLPYEETPGLFSDTVSHFLKNIDRKGLRLVR